ncbi:hypothetical protein B0H63DRAFT_179561 [Podospora didyma]|uniref:WSC domain-containing protein n=1 Tax=Podospora didyma TaxID=330526 RepID=A0AAE0TZ91_9PEZI|nr:hypothetical protein B0H63DRAFT_179561 [Podospora didyma]
MSYADQQLPIPNRAHVDGSGLEVCESAPTPSTRTQNISPYSYSYHKPTNSEYNPTPLSRRQAEPTWTEPGQTEKGLLEKPLAPLPPRKVLGVRLATFAVSCALVLVAIALVLIGGVLGSKISSLEKSKLDVAQYNPTPTTTAAADAPVATGIAVDGYKFLGCHLDAPDRALPGKFFDQKNMTNQLCADLCQGSKFFGTEFGGQCMCGATARRVRANDWDCGNQCTGRNDIRAEICGGYLFLSLWEKTA